MNKLSFAFLFLLAFKIQAQPLQSFLANKSNGMIVTTVQSDGGWKIAESIKTVKISFDTLIGNETFTIVKAVTNTTNSLTGTLISSVATRNYYLQKGNVLLEFRLHTGTIDTTIDFSSVQPGAIIRLGNKGKALIEVVYKVKVGTDSLRVFELKQVNRTLKSVVIEGIGFVRGGLKPEFEYSCSTNTVYTYIKCLKYKDEYFDVSSKCGNLNDIPHDIKMTPRPTPCDITLDLPSVPEINPFSVVNDNKEIKFSQSVSNASITDITGRNYATFAGNIQEVPIQNLPSGLYFLRFESEKKAQVVKFIVHE